MDTHNYRMHEKWIESHKDMECTDGDFYWKMYYKEGFTDRIKCEYCGKVNPSDIHYCVRCGYYIGNLPVIDASTYRLAMTNENLRRIDFRTMGLLEEYERKPRPVQPQPQVKTVHTPQPEGIRIPIKPIPSTTSTDRAENIRVIREQNELYESDQFWKGFLGQLFWIVPAFFGSYLLNGSGLIRLCLIGYTIYGICKMIAAEERWK